MQQTEVAIVGAGLAGLAAARTLTRAGVACVVLDAADAVGGRIRTDVVDGFRLDRGFQILLTAYPEAKAVFDYAALDLCPFEPGAVVQYHGRQHRLMDPWRRPLALLDGALAAVGSLADKLRVSSLRNDARERPPEAIFEAPETSIVDALRSYGFSEAMIDRFWRPFFGGITLDTDLCASSRMMHFVFRCLALGDSAVPRLGMQQLPEQLAAGLPEGVLHLGTRVEVIEGTTLRTGTRDFAARRVILATDRPTTDRLLGRPSGRRWRSVTNLYFALDGPPPVRSPILLLDGERSGLATNVAFMSEVSDAYAPPGRALASISVIGRRPESDADLGALVLRQMGQWFGHEAVGSWQLLRVYRIDRALPDQSPPWLTAPRCEQRAREGIVAAGDTYDTASIDGALTSGRRAAELVLAELGRPVA